MTKSSYKISHFVPKKSSVSGKKPSDTILVEGELAVNTASEKIYLRNNVDSSLTDEKIATFSSDKYIADNYLPLSGGVMLMARADYGYTKYNGEGIVTTFTPSTLSSNESYLFQTSSDGIKASYISTGGSTDVQCYTVEDNSGITIAYDSKSNDGPSTWSNKTNVKFTKSGLTTSTEKTLSIKTQGSGLTVTSSYTQFDGDIKMPYMGDNVVLQDLISGNSYVTSQALNDLNQRVIETSSHTISCLPLSGGTMFSNAEISLESGDTVATSIEDGFFVTDSNLSVGMKYDNDGFDVAKISEHFVSLAKENGLGSEIEEAPKNNKSYARSNGEWVEINNNNNNTSIQYNDLYVGTLVYGNLNANGKIETYTPSQSELINQQQIIMTDSICLPYQGVTLHFKVPGAMECVVYYNSGTTLQSSYQVSYCSNACSERLHNDDTWTAPLSNNGFDALMYRIGIYNVHLTHPAYLTMDEIQAFIDSGEFSITYDSKDNETVIERNNDILPAVHSASYYFYNSGGTSEYNRYQCNIPTIVHASDLHSDYYRFKNAMDFADKIKADCVITSGDYVRSIMYDGLNWLSTETVKHTTPHLPCIGNHDYWQCTTSEFYTNVLSSITNHIGVTSANTSACAYVKDFDDKKIRIISLNQYYITSHSYLNSSTFGTSQLRFLIQSLRETPNGYGVLINIHNMGRPQQEDTNSTFYDDLGAGEEALDTDTSALSQVVDAFIEKKTTNVTFSETTLTCNFSGVSEGTEFIAYLAGHQHRDLITYLDDTSNLQLLLGISADNICGCDYTKLARGNGLGKSQDVFNVYGIDRVNKQVRIVRVGANITTDLTERKIMTIKYSK